MREILIRFLIGGVSVSLFAIIGDLFKPKSFAGLFGAAPSVALATLALTIASEGPSYASVEARSMMIGAIAFLVYASVVSRIMMRGTVSAALVTAACLAIWGVAAYGMWRVILK
jgi:hypothetical protein